LSPAVARVCSREKAGDTVEVTLCGYEAIERANEVIGVYLLAEEHVDFDRIYQALISAATGYGCVMLTVDPRNRQAGQGVTQTVTQEPFKPAAVARSSALSL
jgi:hypothetical protein